MTTKIIEKFANERKIQIFEIKHFFLDLSEGLLSSKRSQQP